SGGAEDGRAGGAGLDRPGRRKRRPGGGAEAATQSVERRGLAGQQQLVVLATAGGPADRVVLRGAGDLPGRGGDRESSQVYARGRVALVCDVAKIGGQPVGEIDHRRDTTGGGEPATFLPARPRAKMSRREHGDRLDRDTSRRLAAVEDGQAGRRPPKITCHGDALTGARAPPRHRRRC